MKHNIEPVTNQYYSCHQILLATYASHVKREHKMILADSWGFGYEKNCLNFKECLHPGYQNRWELLFEKFHGIKVEHTKYDGKDNLINILQTMIRHSPVMLPCDIFDCPWNVAYKRNHIGHYVLVNGIDDNTKHLYILDPYVTIKENTIEINNIAQNKGYIYNFSLKPLSIPQKEDYLLEIINCLKHIKNSRFFQNLEYFKNDFTIRFEEVILSESTDIYAIPLIFNLRSIANQRYCYCIFLNNMMEMGLLDKFALDMMEQIAKKYNHLKLTLMKQIMKRKINQECNGLIQDIIDCEYKLYQKMCNHLHIGE